MSSESGSAVLSERVMNVLKPRINLYVLLYVIILGTKITQYITHLLVVDKLVAKVYCSMGTL